jgi:CubicO group peptidase (beta-lactamase class C family)
MKDTGFSPPSDPERLAVPYADARPEPVRMRDEQVVPYAPGLAVTFSPSRLLHPNSFPSAGAGMVGTAPEFLFFLEVLRNGGSPILSKDSVTELARNQIGDLETDKQQPGWRRGYGFSILEDPSRIDTPQSKGTWQWGGIYGHHWFVDPRKNLSAVVMTNTAVAGTSGAFPVLLCRAIYADLHRQQA